MSETAPTDPRPLRRQALSSFFWSYGGLFGGKISFFLATLILARLLEPEDFGLVAFALAALAYINNLTVHGPGEALLYRSDAHSNRVASTVYWLSIAMSVALTALVWVLSPLVGLVADNELVWILRVLSLQLVITSIASTHGYLLRHSLRFRLLFVPDQLGGLVRGVVSVALALAGFGVWSLVLGQLAGSIATSAALVARSDWRPTFAIARPEVSRTLRVGFSFTLVAILGEAARNLDFIIVGLKLGADELGYYVLAFRLPELAVLGAFEVAWGVLFPFYARVRDSEEGAGAASLSATYLRTVRLGSLIAFPLGFAMAALARPLVLVLYGERWTASVAPLALIAIWAALTAVAGLPGTVFKAVGRPGLLTRCILVYLIVLAPTLLLAATYSITTVAAAHVAVQALNLAFLSAVLGRISELAWWSTLRVALPGIVVGVAVAASLVPLSLLLRPSLALAAGVPLALGVFGLALRLVAPGDVAAVKAFARSRSEGRAITTVQ
jgi:lipopolysaccharide exporter